MFQKPSLITRIAIGKIVGLIVGLICFFAMPFFMSGADLWLRWGILLWYPTLGFIVGITGVFTYHPMLKMSMPWWLRGIIIGGWMNFVLIFFVHGHFRIMMFQMFKQSTMLTSPFWIVVEGAVVGFIIDYLATKFGGEGRSTIKER